MINGSCRDGHEIIVSQDYRTTITSSGKDCRMKQHHIIIIIIIIITTTTTTTTTTATTTATTTTTITTATTTIYYCWMIPHVVSYSSI